MWHTHTHKHNINVPAAKAKFSEGGGRICTRLLILWQWYACYRCRRWQVLRAGFRSCKLTCSRGRWTWTISMPSREGFVLTLAHRDLVRSFGEETLPWEQSQAECWGGVGQSWRETTRACVCWTWPDFDSFADTCSVCSESLQTTCHLSFRSRTLRQKFSRAALTKCMRRSPYVPSKAALRFFHTFLPCHFVHFRMLFTMKMWPKQWSLSRLWHVINLFCNFCHVFFAAFLLYSCILLYMCFAMTPATSLEVFEETDIPIWEMQHDTEVARTQWGHFP